MALMLLVSIAGFSQPDTGQAPYKRFPIIPPFKLLLADSSTVFSKTDIKKDRAVLMMIFSPDCSHCKDETAELMKRIEEFKDVEIIMATMHPVGAMRDFIKRFSLDKQPNITVGRDVSYTLVSFYDLKNLPFHALYGKGGKILASYEGTGDIQTFLEVFSKDRKD